MSLETVPSQTPAQTDVLWFLPTHGDGRFLGSDVNARHITLGYLGQIARAADELGYFGVLLPTGKSCEDSWVVASAMATLTKRLRFLVAVRPGLQTPTVAARMTATLDRLSEGRLLINVVTGGDPAELRGDGILHRPCRALCGDRRIPAGLRAGCSPARRSLSRAITSASRRAS